MLPSTHYTTGYAKYIFNFNDLNADFNEKGRQTIGYILEVTNLNEVLQANSHFRILDSVYFIHP